MLTSDLIRQVFAPLLPNVQSEAIVEEFLVVPGRTAPRWLLPARHQAIGPTLANWSPYRWTSRMKWTAIRGAHSAGCLSALPGVRSVNLAGIGEIDWRSVGWSHGRPPALLVYLGTPGQSRKAVIHLIDPASGDCRAIVKVPLTEPAQAAILREADVLAMLADEGYEHAPRLLYVDRDRGLMTQSAINGKASRREFAAEHAVALRSLMLTGEHTTIAGHAVEWREQLLWSAGCEADIEIMSTAMTELCDAGTLDACWAHGDFAPWNIRRLPDGDIVLLDWEQAQRGALPLQDAFHFFHIQDYLFGACPAVHAADVQRLASRRDIPPAICCKLEVAYLTHAYLQRLAQGQSEHCQHLLQTLSIALRTKSQVQTCKTCLSIVASPKLVPIDTLPVSLQVRSDLFAGVIAQLNAEGIPYCVLSGQQDDPRNSSDVDVMIHPSFMDRLAPMLARAAQNAGARLIQSIRHETSAYYFVIARDDGCNIGYFHPDCASDYRKEGRLWLSAEKVLFRRRRCKELYVAAVSDEFTYYLIKKVLKQSLTEFQLCRLRHLYQRDPANCRAEMLKFWPVATVRNLERALVGSDLGWFQSVLTDLLAELKASAPIESLAARTMNKLKDGLRMLGRLLRPTGMFVLVCGGRDAQRLSIAQGLFRQLAPAFRRVAAMDLNIRQTAALMRLASKVAASRCRSTLVVGDVDGQFFSSCLRSRVARLVLHPDLILSLTDDGAHAIAGAAADIGRFPPSRKGQVICLNSILPVQQNVLRTRGVVIHWLAARQGKRMSPDSEHPVDSSAPPLAEELPEPESLHLVVK